MQSILKFSREIDLGHVVSWLSLMFYMILPFAFHWQYGSSDFPFSIRMGNGYMAYNTMIAVALGSLGALVGGYWWRIVTYLRPNHPTVPLICASAIALFVAIAYQVPQWIGLIETDMIVSKTLYHSLVPSILIIGLGFQLIYREENVRCWCTRGELSSWLSRPQQINTVFFLLFFVLLVVNNLAAISKTELPWLNVLSLSLGRISFYLFITLIFCFVIELILRATPSGLRWLIWSLYGTLIVIVITDAFTTFTLGRPLMGYINGFTDLGEFDWRQELKGAGESYHWLANMSPLQTSLLVAGFFLITLSISLICKKLSIKFHWRFSMRQLILWALISCLLYTTERGIGSNWKSLVTRFTEDLTFQLGLPIFTPESELPKFEITFRSNAPKFIPTKRLTNPPDIYFIMVESMRQDVLTPEITPFLHRFKSEQCQKFSHTWAGSNATHLSWFSLFHSRPPVHWGYTVDAQKKSPSLKGSPTVKWLKNHGYNLEVRAVCDLNYKYFGETNFGEVGSLADVTEQLLPGYFYHQIEDITEREEQAFAETQLASLYNPEGGNFYYLALDSPHYGYFWGSHFSPPFLNYLKDPNKLPVYPSAAEILAYKKRYWNACAWVDFQIQEFIEFLQREQRLDNAVVIITGDHGEEFKEHGNFFHCSNLFPEQTSVPILIKWPKGTDAADHVHASHLDIMPSLLDYLGADSLFLQTLQGHSLLRPRAQHTTIITTNYAGTNGQTMVMRNGNYKATFSWPEYWLNKIPTELTLNAIEFNGQNIQAPYAAECLRQLKKFFPDAFERFIETMRPAQ